MKKANIIGNTTEMSREEWKEIRKSYLGGSDASVALNMNPYKSALQLYYEKVGYPLEDEFDGNLQTKIGNLLEDVVAEVFIEKTGFILEKDTNMYQHSEHLFMLANLDYIVYDEKGNKAILECKTANYFGGSKWKENGVPLHYELQCRHYMAVMNIDICYIACLYDNNEDGFIYFAIERDLDIENKIIEEERLFWELYVKECNEPPIVKANSEKTKEFLNKFYETDAEADVVVLSDEFNSSICDYTEIKKERSILEKEVKELKERETFYQCEFIKAMGNSEKAENSLCIITNKSTQKASISAKNLAKLKIEFPEVYKKFVEFKESKTFRLKEIFTPTEEEIIV